MSKAPPLLLTLCLAACGPRPTSPLCTVPGAICTFAGLPQTALSGEDEVAAQLSGLYYPTEVVVDRAGLVYVLDLNNHRLRRVDEAGFIHTVAGTGFAGIGDAGLATSVDIGGPSDAVIDADGRVLVSLRSSNRVDRYDPSTGYIEVIAGSGWRGFAGDGGPATDALLQAPMGIALDERGALLIADTDNDLIRRVVDGEIETLAGVWPSGGHSGDGGPAKDAVLNRPSGMLRDGAVLYFADSGNHVIRSIDLGTGLIDTVAGTPGVAGFADGSSREAQFSWPADLALQPDGTLLVADELNHCVRAIDPSGQVSTFAGVCGVPGYGGDGGDASVAFLYAPIGVTVGPDGVVYVADTGNHIVRVITPR